MPSVQTAANAIGEIELLRLSQLVPHLDQKVDEGRCCQGGRSSVSASVSPKTPVKLQHYRLGLLDGAALVAGAVDLPRQVEEGGDRLGGVEVVLHRLDEALPEGRRRPAGLRPFSGDAACAAVRSRSTPRLRRRQRLVAVGERAAVVGAEDEEAKGIGAVLRQGVGDGDRGCPGSASSSPRRR